MSAAIPASMPAPMAAPLAESAVTGELPADFSAELAAAWEAVTTPVLVHDLAGIVHANAAMLRLLGYDAAAMAAMPFEGWAAPEQREALRHYGLQAIAQDDPPPAIEIEALTASGSTRSLELTARPLSLRGRRLNVMTVQDLSDMRHVQTSLLDVGRVLHQIIENSPVASFVLDAEHRVTHWNAACAKLTGRDRFDMLGRQDAWSAFYPDERPLLADLIIAGTIEAEGVPLYEGRCRRSETVDDAYEVESFFPQMDGGGRWLFFTAAPLRDAQGNVIGAIETLQDVTQRRRAEEELRRHRAELEELVSERTAELLLTHHELEAFLENASVGIVTTLNQRIVRGNRKFNEMFELDGASPSGIPTRSFFASDEDFQSLASIAYPVLTRGESLQHEMPMVSARGRPLWIQMIAYVANPHDRLAQTWWLLQDRSEVRRVQRELEENYQRIKSTNTRLEEAQNQLLQSEKMASIGQLAAGVAHEINNPIGFVSSNMSTLRGYVEPLFELLDTMQAQAPGTLPEAVDRALRELDRRIDLAFVKEDLPQLLDESDDGLVRVKKIVHDLKDFSRVDHAEWQDADLNAGLESTLNVVMNEVKYKADVKKDYGQLPPVRCIAAQLNQVFMNLIVNAAHAIPQRGEIRLRTRAEGDWVRVEVQDTGTGMSEEVRRRIFEPFFTTKPVGKGTGLGLSLSYSIVQKHAGRIEVRSVPGEGTTFEVWIPVKPPEDVTAPA
ncbi:PAS domain S-box protein [Roseateles sp.]|uniref:PAS domain S-box protein n=1 Tax=Roseateles sp. TaxID=1971397 RepID=UPI0031E188FF